MENIEDYFPIPKDFVEHEDVFMRRVKGDSMVDAGILDGDFVLVNRQETAFNGEIVVALIDGEEATVKRFFSMREPTSACSLRMLPWTP